MTTNQKTPVPASPPTAKAGSPPHVEQTAPDSSPCHCQPQPHGGTGECCCAVHRLEEALLLTESFHFTGEQKAKISELTKKQMAESQALCAKAHEGHKATHAQIVALLTPDQQHKLHAMQATASEPCATGATHAVAGKECHPTAAAPAAH